MEGYEGKRLLFDGRLAVSIPDTFQKMEDGRIEAMYPYGERPQVILEDTSKLRFCTFSLLEKQKLTKMQMERAICTISKAVLSLYPSCLLTEPELLKWDKGSCGWFSFRTYGKGALFHIMYIFPTDGCMMLGTMGCDMEDETGKEQFRWMIKSLAEVAAI